ncbi:MAG: Crp/Fnr family transcriptional regulator [Candidatus Sericytochromatia bacterium]
MIDSNLLEEYKAHKIHFKKGQLILAEGQQACFYYQIITGKVKMSYYTIDGNEVLLGIFSTGESFGEPAMFGCFEYPANAEAIEETILYKLHFEKLKELLKNNFEEHLKITALLSNRLKYKSMIMKEISTHNPKHRIMTLMEYYKMNIYQKSQNELFMIPLTRQQIANMTGLKVETVIRAIKELETQEKLKIEKGKIFL